MPTALKMNILLLPSLLVLIKILSKVKHLICHIYHIVILSEAKNLWRLKVALSSCAKRRIFFLNVLKTEYSAIIILNTTMNTKETYDKEKTDHRT